MELVEKICNEIFLKIHHRTVDLFLCGGASTDKELSKRDIIREKLEEDKRITVLYPEDLFMELLGRKKYDLLTLEKFLAENSDVICIVCESPGSFVELGAFVNNEDTFEKVIAFQQSKYKNKKSFINQGPIALIKSKNKENVIYFNQSIEESINRLKKILNKKFWRTSYKSLEHEARVKDIDLIAGQYYLIMILLYFYRTIEIKVLESNIKKIYLERGYDIERFEQVYKSAIKRLYKERLLKKGKNAENVSMYVLTDKGYSSSKDILRTARVEKRTQTIDNISLKIIQSQYY